jgi:hypothetical protein
MKNLGLIIPVTVLSSITILIGNVKPSQAKPECTPLAVVGGTGTSVTKKISGGVIMGDDYNTDFAVPDDSAYTTFVATIKSDSTEKADLPVEMFLKYSDDTSGKVFEGNVALEPSESKEISGQPRVDQQPYQVNVKIGSIGTSGFGYTLSVVGCK